MELSATSSIGFKHAGIVGFGRTQRRVEQRAKINRAFEAQTHVEKTPRLRARHVLARETVKRREAEQRLIQHADGVAREHDDASSRGRCRAGRSLSWLKHAPHVVGRAVAHEHRQPLQMVNRLPQTSRSRRIKNRREQFRLERLGILAATPAVSKMPGNWPCVSKAFATAARATAARRRCVRD